jgi:hypothetical protein
MSTSKRHPGKTGKPLLQSLRQDSAALYAELEQLIGRPSSKNPIWPVVYDIVTTELELARLNGFDQFDNLMEEEEDEQGE